MQLRRQDVTDWLRKLGFVEVADEASRVLPDPVDLERAEEFGERHGIASSELISRMGGSP